MTKRRREVLRAYRAMARRGETIRPSELARRCGIRDWRNAARIVRDLATIGAI